MKPTVSRIKTVVTRALEEDVGMGDVTTEALISPNLVGMGTVLVKSRGVLAGIQVAEMTFEQVDPSLRFERLIQDGMKVEPGDRAAVVSGKAASILKAERVALNFLQHLSGIATQTAKYVESVSDTKAKILDTRKTIPGLRMFEKYAVKMGGGQNHRANLGDRVLIKDNHLIALRTQGLGIGEAVRKARDNTPLTMTIEIEVETAKEAKEADDAGADIVLLDNMSVAEMKRAVKATKGLAQMEASGGITLQNVHAVAKAGVDYISIGALTHSAAVLDISLEIEIG